MKDSIATIGELKELRGSDDVCVLIDPIDYYKLLVASGTTKREAVAKVTQFVSRRKMHSDINNAIDRRRAFLEKRPVFISPHLSMHEHYLKSARVERMFVNRLP